MEYNMKMKSFLIIIMISMTVSCTTYYRIRTNFIELNRGMDKQSVLLWLSSQKDVWRDDVVGGKPFSSKTFKHNNDVWEVWIFEVYKISGDDGYFSHYEHLAFKNSVLEEWGEGDLPITIRQNPNQFKYDINIKSKL